MIRIGLLYGGMSSEHDVSLCSAASVYSTLDKNKYEIVPIGIDRDGRWYVQQNVQIVKDKSFGNVLTIKKDGCWLLNHFEDNNNLVLYNTDSARSITLDFILPVIHGTNCEDGRLQGLLELAGVPYAGADLTGSAIGMDKDVAKRLLKQGGVPVVPWITVNIKEWENNSASIIDKSVKELGIPLFIKPSSAGSSIGISKVREKENLRKAADDAFLYDNKILIEKAVNCREIECSVLGNLDPQVSIAGEIIPSHEFYSYEAKYIDSDGAKLGIPAQIDERISSLIRETALKGYRLLCCSGMARVDFFLEKGTDRFYLNEINTLPGFTSISMYPKLWENTGLKYSDLLDKLVELGFESHRARRRLKTRP